MGTSALDEAAVQDLTSRVRGPVITPADESYEAARAVWNASIDRRPAAVVRVTGAADVIACLAFAREHDLPVALRGGAHNVAGFGTCEGGIVIDQSARRGVTIDPAARIARVEAGATWAEFDREAQVFGLATTGGVMTSTGVAGFTLGGGIGWLMRRDGLAVDLLRSVQMVTTDGRVVTASEDENPDLFWALRGGGGNFGVVTSFEFELRPTGPTVLGGMRLFPLEQGPEVMAAVRDLMAGAPDELTLGLVLRHAPPSPVMPKELHFRKVVAIGGMYAGDIDEGREVLRPLDKLGDPLFDAIGPKPYSAVQAMSDGAWQPGFRNYWKAEYLGEIDDAAINTAARFADSITSKISDFKIVRMGGAVSRVPEDATAVGTRDATWVLNINSRWTDASEDDTHITWTRELYDAMQPASAGGTYVNFLGEEGEERIRHAYGAAKWDRLRSIKKQWDPGNVLRINQNIPPA